MSKQLTLLLLFLLIGVTAQAQYRALTVEGFAGKGLDTNTEFYGGSVNLTWEFDNTKWFLMNWTGISYDVEQPQQRWFASDISMNRKLGNGFSTGGGIQYRNALLDNIDGWYGIIRIRKTFNLN